jgi:Mg2+ and Co2+ transporter CorA
MVPTFVVSIFSMNVDLPFGLKEHPAFWLIMGLGAVAMVGFLIFWKYKKW